MKSLFTLAILLLYLQTSLLAQAQLIDSSPRTVAIDLEAFRLSLQNAPAENSREAREKPLFIALPTPGGDRRFRVERNSLMAPAFAARYPGFRTYNLQAADDARVTGHMTLTPYGVLATIFSREGLIEISPENMNQPVMHKVSIPETLPDEFSCGFLEEDLNNLQISPIAGVFAPNGSVARTYTLAIVTTGEYGQTHGGTVGTATAAVVQLIGALEDIYERELAVKFSLLMPRIYLDPITDPFPSANANRTLMAAEAVAMNWPNPAEYDLGHVLHSAGGNGAWGGGVAYFGLCSTGFVPGSSIGLLKGGAWSSVGTAPTGDVRLMAHEMGHQFYMPHTFNGSGGSCTAANIFSNSAYEIGSGTTIMSYRNICGAGQNVPSGGIADHYFHTTSLQAAYNRMLATSCETPFGSGNTPPEVDANPCGGTPAIPIGTPFKLTGSGSDPEGDPLFYNWEQVDEDGAGTPTQGKIGAAAAADPLAPLFRSYPPGPSPFRYFPNLELIKAGDYDSSFEPLPTVARTINLQLTGRDNRSEGGGVGASFLTISVSAAGPFEVDAPNGGETLTAGAGAAVTWNENGTDAFCSSVTIKLSVDGGSTYPYTLAVSTPNDGAENVNIPAGAPNSPKARIMVECADNSCVVFFDISDADLDITSDCLAPSTEIETTASMTFTQGEAGLDLGLTNNIGEVITGFSGSVTTSDTQGNLIFFNGAPPTCAGPSNFLYQDIYTFSVDLSGSYTIEHGGPFGTVLNLYQAPYTGSNCTNHIGSSAVRPSGTGAVTLTGDLTADLVAGDSYVLVVSGFSSTLPTYPFNYDVAFPSMPPGANVYDGAILPAGYAYTYLAVNTANDQATLVDASSDFTSLNPGTYHIYGAAYYDGAGPDPAPVNPASWPGQTLDQILQSGACVSFSDNYKAVTVLPPCAQPVFDNVSVTSTTCSTSTGEIIAAATGGPLEYSADNGVSWQTSGVFSSLPPGNYYIKARLQSDPGCIAAYPNNPAVINHPPVVPPILEPTVIQPSCDVNSGTIIVNVLGNESLEYSINNGASWQASNTFAGLLPGSYFIRVRLESDPACIDSYDDNPVVIENLALFLANSICPAEAMVFGEGSPGLDLALTSYKPTPVFSHSFEVSSIDPDMNRIRWNNSQTACITPGGTTDYQIFRFVVDQGGLYGFSFNDFRAVHIFTDPFDPNDGCATFVASSVVDGLGYYNGIPGGAVLDPCVVYNLVAVTEGFGGNTTVSFSGPGDVYPVFAPPHNTAYVYSAVNTSNGQVAAVSASADFTSLEEGSYHILGAVYYDGPGPDPAPVNPESWVGQTINQVMSGDDCIAFSDNFKPLTVEYVCIPPAIGQVNVTQPTAGTPTGLIVVNATGDGTLEFSIDNGVNWSLSNTFSDLSPGDYYIQVRLESHPSCLTSYAGNPLVINEAPTALLVIPKIYLQGPYDLVEGLMRDNLRSNNLLPLTEPYTGLGYVHAGGGGGETAQQAVFDISGEDAVVDWVFVELRDKNDASAVLATRSALLQRDGDVVDVDGFSPVAFDDLPADDYYLAVRHRNHLGVMSAALIVLSGAATEFDFTGDLDQTLGGANGIAALGDGRFGMYSGDFNGNGQVQNTDYAAMVLTLGTAGYVAGDLDLNTQVQNTDLLGKLVPNIGRGAALP